jgi:outer membrane receptor protein involved in Fe transport
LSTNAERTITTNDVGIFSLPSLVASKYELTISASGFRSKSIKDLEINAFQNLALGRVQLELGTTQTTVEVLAEVPKIITENAVRNDVIQAKQVTEMPLQGRNWSTLLKVIPGSSPNNVNAINGRDAGYDGYGDFRVNGKASNQTQVNLDGGSNVDHGSDTKTTVTPSLEAIQEVAVLANNFQAEYGNRAGVVINIVTKSGSNQWHGTAWDYLRNEVLNAAPWSNNFFGLGNPRYRYNYYGGNLSGPIRKDKLFFFYNYENLKQDSPTLTNQIRVPTELERKGDFSQTVNANGTRPTIYYPGTQASGNPIVIPNNIIPQNLINPLGTAIMNIYPLPNLKNETNNNYLNQYAKVNNRYLNVVKVDYNISDTMRAYVRFNYDKQDYTDMITWMAGSNLPFVITGWSRPDKALTANLTKTMSSNMVVETLFNWQKDFLNGPIERSLDPEKIDKAKMGLSGLPVAFPTSTNILPQIQGTGYQDFQFNRFPLWAIAPEYQIAQTWAWTKGTHLFKWGGQFMRNQKDEINQAIDKGNYNFGVNTSSDFDMGYSPANVLTGALTQFTQVSNPSHKLSVFQDFHFFVQDTWKVNSRVTLDFGIRVYHIPTEHNTQYEVTMDAAFVPGKWDPKKAPRYYVVNPKNTKTLIDPAYPDNPLPANVFNALLYSIVPGSGDILNGVVPLTKDTIGEAGIRDPNFLLFAPRGGIAWKFTDKTVLRAGFGWSYNRPTIGQATGTFQNGMADQADYRQTSLSTLTNSSVKRISPRSFGAYDESSNAAPTVYDYSISIQRELPFNMVLDVAYVGNIQRHQVLQFNINQVLPGTSYQAQFKDPRLAGNNFYGPISASNPGPLPGTQAVDSNLMRPYVGFGTLNLITNVGNGNYNALQWSVNKRLSHGLTFMVSHTWSKLRLGTESFGPFFSNWKDYTGYIANEHRPQVWGVTYNYDVPSLRAKMGWSNGFAKQVFDGWALAHMMNFYSGRALTADYNLQYAGNTQGVANFNSTFTGSPDIAPRILSNGTNANNGLADTAHMFNTSAFVIPGLGGVGMGSRNYLWSRGTFSNDINVSKQFPIRERLGLELRASFFNPFNQVRRQDENLSLQYKMKGRTLEDGYYLYNSPEQLVTNLLERLPNSTEAEKYNQYRGGVGHENVTSVLDMRRIEIGIKLRF